MIEIIFEDNHILVAYKPPGVLSQAGELDLPDMLTSLKSLIKERDQKPGNVFLGLVHRLDVNVGGVMVFAKTSKAAKRLFEQMQKHQFNKKYFAIVLNPLSIGHKERLVDDIYKDEERKMAIVQQHPQAKVAILEYEVISNAVVEGHDVSLLDILLETGRFHQIRAQFSHRGHPLFGDVKYGGNQTTTLELGLFSYQIEFEHPVSKKLLQIKYLPQSELFQSFSQVLRNR